MNERIKISEIQPNQEVIVEAVKQKKLFLFGLGEDMAIEANNRICDITDKLEDKYPDAEEYRLYHVLAGSSPRGDCPKFDFPGDDSIVKTVEDLYNEYKGKERE